MGREMIERYLQAVAILGAMIVALTAPARAAVIVNAANVGYNFSIDYAGQVGGAATPQISALGKTSSLLLELVCVLILSFLCTKV